MTLLDRLASDTPKRILALDGGGIRGILTVEFLSKIEQTLRTRHNQPTLKLCDYFDLIGGTSTGAIIAGALAIGLDASEIKQLYFELGGKVFGKRQWRKWRSLFDPAPLEQELTRFFGERTLGDESLKTGLCVITKRADTGSTWSLLNHPGAKYYSLNKSILLRDVIRASAAAPVFFVPEKLEIGGGLTGAFVDGGVSMANNPALQLFLVATLKGFPFRWSTGENQLLMVSVGTGAWRRRDDADAVANGMLWDWAIEVPAMFMEDANWQNQLLLQYLSRSRTPWTIDDEVGDLSGDLLPPEPALTYLRYNSWLEREELCALGLNDLAPKAASLCDMTVARNSFDLSAVGQKSAERQVQDEHFPKAFDLA
jgi:hypothetical protein